MFVSFKRVPSTTPDLTLTRVRELLGDKADELLSFDKPAIPKTKLMLPGTSFVDSVFAGIHGGSRVADSMRALRDHGRLKGTGYYSFLPVDQGIEHDVFTFAKNLAYADPMNILELAEKGGCNAVATTYGAARMFSEAAARYRMPVIVKINHNELLTHPLKYDQVMFATAKAAHDIGATAIGITIYFGSKESNRQLQEVRDAFQAAHELGMATVAWCYLRSSAFKVGDKDYAESADLTAQANHLAASLGADIVKQKAATCNGGVQAIRKRESAPGKTDNILNSKDSDIASATGEHVIDWNRAQVIAGLAGRVGLINSGGASGGKDDLAGAVRTAVINYRAGGTGLISGRKAFQKPMAEGIALLHAIQDVYLLGALGEISIP